MADPSDEKAKPIPSATKAIRNNAPNEERMEDEEKILEGRKDVNYPALLTKDVPGG